MDSCTDPMARGYETLGAASSSGSFAAVAAHELRRQRSTPAAFVTSCGGGGVGRRHASPRDGGDDDGGGGGYGEFRARAPAGRRRAGGGVGAVARALWAWIVRGRRKKAVSRSGSVKGQYGHEDYAENFDEGAAAAEPENLSRSFSARYAARRRHDGPASPWDGGARR